MPELEELVLFHMGIDKETKQPIPELNLHKLKKLDSYESLVGEKMNILKAIPAGVIEGLSWKNCFQREKAKEFLRKQPNIKNLQLGDESLADESDFNALNLSSLTIKNDFDPPFKMFCRQRNLTSLSLKEVPLNTVMFNIICSMKQLTSLKFDIAEIPNSALVSLETLPNLKSLVVSEGGEEDMEAIRELNMPQLESLGLWMFPALDCFWEDTEHRYENLKKIRYGPCMDISILEDLMIHYPKLDSIKIAVGGSQWEDEDDIGLVCNRFYCPDEVYNKMKKLYVCVDQFRPKTLDIMQFVDLCTNLEEIVLFFPLDIDNLRHILSTKNKLKKLTLWIDEESSKYEDIGDKIVNPIDEDGRNLRAINLYFGVNTWNMKLDIEFVKKRLANDFASIEMNPCELNLKKRGVGPRETWDE